MVTATYPWSIRGGNPNNDAKAGVFAFSNANEAGNVSVNISFRRVMITNKKI